jgi:nitrate reductase assembly molybdenum cofactor insertion protein NarJ
MRSNLNELASLFDYPGPDYHHRVCKFLQAGNGVDIAGFAAAIASLSVTEVEELYARTFDLNPDGCLDIGWHLFGEDYARGEFLVHLRQQERRYGVPETSELPDHLTRVLPLVARMPEDEAAEFESRFLVPALEKIAKAIDHSGNPYTLLMAGLQRMLSTKVGMEA